MGTFTLKNGDGSKPWYLVNPLVKDVHPTKNVSIGIDPYPNGNLE